MCTTRLHARLRFSVASNSSEFLRGGPQETERYKLILTSHSWASAAPLARSHSSSPDNRRARA